MPRTDFVHIRVTPDEKMQVEREADRLGVDSSKLIRVLLKFAPLMNKLSRKVPDDVDVLSLSGHHELYITPSGDGILLSRDMASIGIGSEAIRE